MAKQAEKVIEEIKKKARSPQIFKFESQRGLELASLLLP